MRYVYIDGYNVINSWPELRKIKDHSLEGARNQLIDTIQEYAVYRGHKVFIVFDAHMVLGSIEKREKIGDVMVVFTKEGETADSFIEKSVNNIGRKKDVLVVTSDSLEQQLAFQRGATRMSSIEFRCEINNIRSKINLRTQKDYSRNRTWLEDVVDKETLEKLEKIRRNN
ncbi:NYN domain-containing protein [Haloimpatiens massiliensis]|uniref:NYN domain-containing protein n=1 Tax=Haloimpatiens massiliensis TaxID=1658110 RepID=UPI000C833EEF|nr:NYN domain-containing protein [Haloimpatiens massiliensis]